MEKMIENMLKSVFEKVAKYHHLLFKQYKNLDKLLKIL